MLRNMEEVKKKRGGKIVQLHEKYVSIFKVKIWK